MPFLFPCEVGSPRKVDSFFEEEYKIVCSTGYPVFLIDHDLLQKRDIFLALKKSGMDEAFDRGDIDGNEKIIYRGWMVDCDAYEKLDLFVKSKGLKLLNSATQYKLAHFNSFLLDSPSLQQYSPQIGVARLDDQKISEKEVNGILDGFGSSGVIIKDFVKSQSSLWFEACYIPDCSNREHAWKVINKFIDLQGDFLQGGLIFKQYHCLCKNQGGTTAEYRGFMVNGQIACLSTRDGNPLFKDRTMESLLVEQLISTSQKIAEQTEISPFYTIDWAVEESTYLPFIIEIGDGGVSEIPPSLDKNILLNKLINLEQNTQNKDLGGYQFS